MKVLRDYQKEGVERAVKNFNSKTPYFFLLFGPRKGKTLTAVEICNRFKARKVLVLCPPIVIPVWRKEFEENSPISNVGIHSSSKIPDDKTKYDIIIFDEVHGYRNRSDRAQNAWKLKGKFKLGLSATPIESYDSEMFYIMRLMDGGTLFGKNREAYEKSFCRPIDPMSVYTKYEFTDKVREAFSCFFDKVSMSYQVDMDLPEMEKIVYQVTDKQKDILKRLKVKRFIPEIRNEHFGKGKAIIGNKERQLLGGFYIFDDGRSTAVCRTNKWSVLLDTVRKHGSENVLLWCFYRQEVAYLLALFPESKELSSSTLQEMRQGKLRILVANPRSASVGIDVSCADVQIFVTIPHSSIDYTQSIHRLSKHGDDATKKSLYELVPSNANYKSHLKSKIDRVEDFLNLATGG